MKHLRSALIPIIAALAFISGLAHATNNAGDFEGPVGIGTATPQGLLTIYPSSTVASAASATLDYFSVPAATTTITGTTGITTSKGFNAASIYKPTYTASSSVTITNAATLYIDNAPAAAGSVTITNPWAISVGAGNVSFPGTGNALGTITSGTWNGTQIGVAYGGTNCTSASITCFNNITGYTASGATGTTSTNLVFSTSPSITTPTFVTSATGPVIYGGTGASSTLTLDGTSNGSPSNAYVLLNPSGQGGVGIGTSVPLSGVALDVRGTTGTTLEVNQLPVINKIVEQTFVSVGTTTYTPTAGMVYADVTVCGGGGQGGSAAAGQASQGAPAGGGAAGGCGFSLLTAATIGTSQSVTIGTGGASAAAGQNTGTTGGSSSFGSLITCNGGGGGTGASSSAVGFFGGGNGGTCSGGNILNATGSAGSGGMNYNGLGAAGGTGAPGLYGLGAGKGYGYGGGSDPGGAASGCAAGGGGAFSGASSAAAQGGAGATGCAFVKEYISN
jgi:hypothetical protein